MLNEKREYFRLRENLPIEFREIEEWEFASARERMILDSKRIKLKSILPDFGTLEDSKGKNREILLCLELINKKLDLLLESMNEKDKKEGFVRGLSTIDVSGSGLRFLSDRKPKKSHLELLIFLPDINRQRIRIIAEVVRVNEKKVGDDLLWEIAVRYVEILEDDRDALIAYLIEREREIIKKRKADE